MRWVAAEERSPLPVVGPHLQKCLFEWPRGQRVQDGVESAVDWQNEDDDPRADGSCRGCRVIGGKLCIES